MALLHKVRDFGVYTTLSNLEKWNKFTNCNITFESPVDLNGQYPVLEIQKIGGYTYIQGGTFYAVKSIGRFCSLAANVYTGPAEHPSRFLSSSPFFYTDTNTGKWPTSQPFKEFIERNAVEIKKTNAIKNQVTKNKKLITIGNDVWIGLNVTIFRGVTIGDGAIIAGGAVITKDVPPYAIVGGVPGKVIKYRFSEEIIESLLELKWWNYQIEILDGLDWTNVDDSIVQLQKRAASGNYEPFNPATITLSKNGELKE